MSNDASTWFRKRKYLHFDSPISEKAAKKLVLNPERVAENSFFPFIKYKISSKKLYRDPVSSRLKLKPKSRTIAYSSHKDSLIYSYYTELLSATYEGFVHSSNLHQCVLAFRSIDGKNNIHFAKSAFDCIRGMGVCSAVALDISGFFDNLDHRVLKQQWCRLLNVSQLPRDHYAVYKSITQHSSVDRDRLYKAFDISVHNPKNNRYRVCSAKEFREKVRASGLIEKNPDSTGIPQGSPISAFLSNVYMMDFDQKVKAIVDDRGGYYFRYCDDMLFIVPTEFRNDVEKLVAFEIGKLNISINPEKTEIRDFKYEDGVLTSTIPLQYLGFTYDGRRILIRSAALARYSERMKRGVRLAKRTQRKKNWQRVAKGQNMQPLYKRKIYERYSHLSKRNFITYGYRAAEIMESNAIRKQLKPLWPRLQKEIEKVDRSSILRDMFGQIK